MVQSSGPQLTDGVREGDVLAGKYRVDRVLGAGAMGIVVAAHHVQLDRKVAIKFLLPAMLQEAEAVGRFSREARAAAKIRSEHVAQVLDVGTLDSGAPYMVMEFLDGSDLAEWLRRRGPLPFGEAVEFVLQACAALAEAHSFGIVHRDLKPANLFCTRRPDGSLCIKVLDFGISKLGGVAGGSPAEASMTRTSAVMGTPYYMSPEQLRASRDVDPRTDIWAMGVILHELTTGQVPFTGESLSDICIKIATEEPPPLRALRPDAPAGLEAVLARCLQKDRNSRYGSVAEFARALAPYAPQHSRSSVERVSATLHEPGAASAPIREETLAASAGDFNPGTLGALGRTTGASRGRKTAAIAIVGSLGVVVAIGVVAAVLVSARARPGTAPTAAASASPLVVPASSPARGALPWSRRRSLPQERCRRSHPLPQWARRRRPRMPRPSTPRPAPHRRRRSAGRSPAVSRANIRRRKLRRMVPRRRRQPTSLSPGPGLRRTTPIRSRN